MSQNEGMSFPSRQRIREDKKIHLLFVEKWESIGDQGGFTRLIRCAMDLTLTAISHNIFLRKPCKTFFFHGFLLEIVLDLVLNIPPPMLEATGVN